MIAAVPGDVFPHIVQGMSVALFHLLQIDGDLIARTERAADLRLAHRRIDIDEFVIHRLHQSADGFADLVGDILCGKRDKITVDVHLRLF